MMSNARCWRLRLAVLVIATSWLTGCAAVGSEPTVAICPPVAEDSAEFQARAADELMLLPEGLAVSGRRHDADPTSKKVARAETIFSLSQLPRLPSRFQPTR